MQRRQLLPPGRDRRHAFTLVELLVTIGIITVLLAILVPVVSHVRINAQTTASQALIQRIAVAINNYHNDFRGYPGALPNSAFPGNIRTQTEDMVVALLGGLTPNGGAGVYDPGFLGTGTVSFNPVAPGKKSPYLDKKVEELSPNLNARLGDASQSLPQLTYITADTNLPEFLDLYSQEERRPILYMRANAGAMRTNDSTYVVSTAFDRNYHYNLGSIMMYLKSQDPLYTQSSARTFLTGQTGNSAKFAGSFILIGAGPDHLYGTSDDIIMGGGGGQ